MKILFCAQGPLHKKGMTLFHENFVLCTRSSSQKGMTLFHENFVLCTSFSHKGMTFNQTITNCGEMTQQGAMNFLRDDDDVDAMALSVEECSSVAAGHYTPQTEGGAPHPSCNALLPGHYPA
jgi:hypothetical protein